MHVSCKIIVNTFYCYDYPAISHVLLTWGSLLMEVSFELHLKKWCLWIIKKDTDTSWLECRLEYDGQITGYKLMNILFFKEAD